MIETMTFSGALFEISAILFGFALLAAICNLFDGRKK